MSFVFKCIIYICVCVCIDRFMKQDTFSFELLLFESLIQICMLVKNVTSCFRFLLIGIGYNEGLFLI